jgi:large subunit ribosomal protein L24e
MARCSFCGTRIEPGTGKMHVKKDGNTLHFCSMKCEKNLLKLGRNPQKKKWTETYKTIKKGQQ